MMTTHTASDAEEFVPPAAYAPPSLEEALRLLCGLRRWKGDTITPWTVGQHTLAGLWLLDVTDTTAVQRLQFLLHDVEESIVGDTPRPFKTAEQAALGDWVRRDIFRHLIVPYPHSWEGPLQDMDDRLAEIESHILRARPLGPLPTRAERDMIYDLVSYSPHEVAAHLHGAFDELVLEGTVRRLRERL